MASLKLRSPLRFAVLLAAGCCALLLSVSPAQAAVLTVHSCAQGGGQDSILNGFHVQNVAASNLHTVQLYYKATSSGTYNVSITARRNSYAGPLVATLSKSLQLNASLTTVLWDFGDAAIISGDNLYFTHTSSGGSGTVQFNLNTGGCSGNQESVGTSNVDNGVSVATFITTHTTGGANPTCFPSASTLCLDNQPDDRRFQVRVTYSTVQNGGQAGSGKALSLSSVGVTQGGLFSFFSATNPEVLVKVLNGCSLNNRFWVFITAGTNVGFTATVTDLKTGRVSSYINPDVTSAKPVQDTTGNLTCN